MKKMYFITVIIIGIITLVFLKFYRDDTDKAMEFLTSYGYETKDAPTLEAYRIPKEFEGAFRDYSLMLLSCGFDLSPYKGAKAQKITFKISNVSYPLYANIILYKGKIIGADLVNPQLSGFILPIIHINDLMKYQIPAINDEVIP